MVMRFNFICAAGGAVFCSIVIISQSKSPKASFSRKICLYFFETAFVFMAFPLSFVPSGHCFTLVDFVINNSFYSLEPDKKTNKTNNNGRELIRQSLNP